jgi:DNA-binding response OmpR family regulator
MLHMFFRLMELECSLIPLSPDPVATVRRLAPDLLILDLDLPDLRALDIARALRTNDRAFPVIFLTDDPTAISPMDVPLMPKPRDRFEHLLELFELVLSLERS